MSVKRKGNETTASVSVKGGYDLISDVSVLKKLGLHRKIGDLPIEIKSICREL